jgi:hypothetical protein
MRRVWKLIYTRPGEDSLREKMIHQLYHFHKSGLVLTSEAFGSKKFNISPELVSGFLSALRMFGQDLLSDDVTQIETGNYQFVWHFADPVLSVALCDRQDDPEAILAMLKTLNYDFLTRYQSQLRKWTGEVVSFRAFVPVARDIIRDYLPSLAEPAGEEAPEPEVFSLWERFGAGLDTVIYGLIAGIPLLVVGRKPQNQPVVTALRSLRRWSLQTRRIPVMYFEDASAALQVLQIEDRNQSFILSLPNRAYEQTFAKAPEKALKHVALDVQEAKVNAVGFEPKQLNIAAMIDHAANTLGKTGAQLRSVADRAFLTARGRVEEVAQLLAVTPQLPDEDGAALLRVSLSDYQTFRSLADQGGYIRREAKGAVKSTESEK